jgi:hypothetical protein
VREGERERVCLWESVSEVEIVRAGVSKKGERGRERV